MLLPPPHRSNRYRSAVTSRPMATSHGSGVAKELTNVSVCIYVAFYNAAAGGAVDNIDLKMPSISGSVCSPRYCVKRCDCDE